MLGYRRVYMRLVLGLLLAGCGSGPQPQTKGQPSTKNAQEPAKGKIFQGGDDSPITIADGSCQVYSKKLDAAETTPNKEFTYTLPGGLKFYFMLEENPLAITDLTGLAPWTITIEPHNETLYSADGTKLVITAKGSSDTLKKDTTADDGSSYANGSVVHHSNTNHISKVTLEDKDHNKTMKHCNPKIHYGPCHIVLWACDATKGCT